MQVFKLFFWPLIHYVFLNSQNWQLQICVHTVLEDLKTNYNWKKRKGEREGIVLVAALKWEKITGKSYHEKHQSDKKLQHQICVRMLIFLIWQ